MEGGMDGSMDIWMDKRQLDGKIDQLMDSWMDG